MQRQVDRWSDRRKRGTCGNLLGEKDVAIRIGARDRRENATSNLAGDEERDERDVSCWNATACDGVDGLCLLGRLSVRLCERSGIARRFSRNTPGVVRVRHLPRTPFRRQTGAHVDRTQSDIFEISQCGGPTRIRTWNQGIMSPLL